MDLFKMSLIDVHLLIVFAVLFIVLTLLLIVTYSKFSKLRKKYTKMCIAYNALSESSDARELYVKELYKSNNEKHTLVQEKQAQIDAEFNMRILLIQHITELQNILTKGKLVVLYKDKIYNSFSINKDGKASLRIIENKQNVNRIVDIHYQLDDNVFSKKDLQAIIKKAEDTIIGIKEEPTAPITNTTES